MIYSLQKGKKQGLYGIICIYISFQGLSLKAFPTKYEEFCGRNPLINGYLRASGTTAGHLSRGTDLATGQPSRWSPVVLDLVICRPKSWEIGLQRGWNMIWLVVYLPLVRNKLFIYG